MVQSPLAAPCQLATVMLVALPLFPTFWCFFYHSDERHRLDKRDWVCFTGIQQSTSEGIQNVLQTALLLPASVKACVAFSTGLNWIHMSEIVFRRISGTGWLWIESKLPTSKWSRKHFVSYLTERRCMLLVILKNNLNQWLKTRTDFSVVLLYCFVWADGN